MTDTDKLDLDELERAREIALNHLGEPDEWIDKQWCANLIEDVAQALADKEAETIERAAVLLEEWCRPSELFLHAGEMTQRELGIVVAVLKARAAAIRKMGEGK